MKYTSPRGTRDILPEEMDYWHLIENASQSIFELYNYEEIRTPIFEMTELFERSIGETTDIVEKEMYTFMDKGGRKLTLRPEGTASVVRAYIEQGLYKKKPKVKLYYSGPMFRYERPQAGRYRQFYQIGIENIGNAHPFADAEVIS
ncbi:ATP phosphoribosyltransferase regulatory subunit, partial [Thermoproteota archaeon]